jgi:hypothetical protein
VAIWARTRRERPWSRAVFEWAFSIAPVYAIIYIGLEYCGSKIVDREILERLVVRLVGMAHRCTDHSTRSHLMRLATELIDLIEGQSKDKEIAQRH